MTQGAEFRWPVRVYYDDTDFGGIVYHASYLKMMEHARTEWLRALGIEQDVLLAEQGKTFAVVDMTLRFSSPARFNDRLTVTVRPREAMRTSVTFDQEVYRDADGTAAVEASVRAVCLRRDGLRPSRLPREVLAEVRDGI